jgi:dolichol-phosphate mannosyltransferase
LLIKDINGVPNFEVQELEPKSTKYCVCIPIINEGERIKAELERAFKHDVHKVCDIIICDGGSTDGCTELEALKSLGVNTLLTKKDTGKQGAQLRMGMWWALQRGYEGIITIDGNNKDSIEDVPSFVAKLDEGYDFVQGSRFVKGGKAENTPIVRDISLKLIHAPVISLTAGKRYTDTTNAYRAYSAKYLQHPKVLPFREIFVSYELLAYLSVRADQLGLKTCEIPVARVYPKNEKTPTKISFFKGNYNLLKILFLNSADRYIKKADAPLVSKRKSLLQKSLLFLSVLTLFLGFFNNTWKVVNQDWFDSWERFSESLIIGRMQETKTEGSGAFKGLLLGLNIEEQYESFLAGEPFNKDEMIGVYTHQYGLQGRFFGLINAISPFSPKGTLQLCYGINALILAVVITLLLWWIYGQLGGGAAVFGWAAAISAQWITLSARNLYWCTWTMLLPMLCVLFFIKWEEKSGRERNILLFLTGVITVFIRAACGYEYISTVLIVLEAPLIYYAVKQHMPLKLYIKRASILGFGAILGFLLAITIHLFTISQLFGSFPEAVQELSSAAFSRTGVASTNIDWEKYFLSFTVDEITRVYLYEKEPLLFGWYGGMLAPFFAFFSALSLAKVRGVLFIGKTRRNMAAFSLMLGTAFAGVMSWFILARVHSAMHYHINYILWGLPFLIFGMAICGAVCCKIFARLWLRCKGNVLKSAGLIALSALLALGFIGFNQIKALSVYSGVSQAAKKAPATQTAGLEVYRTADKIYYVADKSFDYTRRLFVEFYPTDTNDLPEYQREQGYDVHEFMFEDKEQPMPSWSDKRVIVFIIPTHYTVKSVVTGQIGDGSWIWSGDFT